MITLLEIQEAIAHLNAEERSALSLWLTSQTPLTMSASEEQALLQSLDAAASDLDAGKGVPLDEVRKQLRAAAFALMDYKVVLGFKRRSTVRAGT